MRIDARETCMGEDMLVTHDDEPYTGEVEHREADGTIVAVITYYEGIEHGPHHTWYVDGTKRSQGIANMGAAVGQWRRWHPDGRLACLQTFDNHGRQLHRTEWDREGNVVVDRPQMRPCPDH